MKRALTITSILLISILFICISVACKKEVSSSTQSAPQELTIAYGNDTDANSKNGVGDMLLKIFNSDRLVELVGDEVKPSLAESWDLKDNGQTIVFHLRKDVKFSDGTPFTADAVKFTYDRLKKFKLNQWTQIDRIASIEVNGPNTITFHIKPGQEGFIVLTAFAEYQSSIMSPNSTDPKGDPGAPLANLTGTGPWKVADYKKNQYTEFVPNPYYYGKKPTLDKVTVKYIPQAQARVLAIQSGSVDAVVDYYHGGSSYTPRNMLKTLQDQGFQVLKKELPMTVVLACNYKKAPWNNVEVRQGLNYAVNKDDVAALFDGWLTPAKTRMFSDLAPFIVESGEQEYPFNLDQAAKMFKEAGLTGDTKINLMAQGQNPDEVKLCELIKSQLAKTGLNVQLDVLESGLYSDRQKNGDWDLRVYYIGGPERRKYTRIAGRFDPDSAEFGPAGYFTSPELIPSLRKAVGSFNQEEREENFKVFYNKAKDLAGGVPLYYDAVFVVAKQNVKNIEYVSTEPRFDNVFIANK